MKKILLFLLCMVLLIGSVSASVFGNILDYSDDDLKVTLRNSILWIFPTSEIGTIELKSHPSVNYVKEVGAGNQIVMWYDFNFVDLYLNGLGEIEFTDMRTDELIDRDYSFVYWGENERDVYGCEYSFSVNGTKICNSVVVGKETYDDWLPYNSKDIPKGDIRIGLMTYVEVDDRIDSVWTIAGKKVKKHALWEASLDVGLVSCFNFNEDTGATAIDIVGSNNLTNTGMAINQTTGAVEGTSYAGGDNKYVNRSTGFSAVTGNHTISLYLYHNNLKTFSGVYHAGDSNQYYPMVDASGGLDVHLGGRPTKPETPDATIVTGQAQHIVITKGGDDWAIYVDNVSVENHTQQQTITGQRLLFTNDYANLATRGLAGYIDMACIWNRTLTYEEATTNDMIYIIVEELKITLISPEDTANFTTQIVNFSANVSDPYLMGIENVSLIVDGVINQTNTSGIEGNYSWINMNFSDGNYNWTVIAYNDSDDLHEIETRDFNVNTTPFIQFENPTQIDYYNSSSSYIPVNVSLTETYFENITFSFYNDTLTEFYYEDDTRFINESLADGIYNYNVTVWTTTDQTNTTETRNITIDTTNPAVIIFAPSLTINHHLINTNLSVNWSANDTHIDTCILQFEGINRTVTCSDNQTQINITNLVNRTIIFYVNDTFGYMNATSRSWNYTAFENSQEFNNETLEGVINTFTANVTIIESNSIAVANLIYNETSYTGSFSQSGNDSIMTINILAPNIDAETNLTFFWSLTLSDSQVINLTSYNQTVITISLDNCSTNTVVLYNYTVVDEGNQSLLSNTTTELNVNLLDVTRENYIFNFSNEYLNENPFAVCINKNLSSSTYVVDSIVKYKTLNHSIEYYNIANATITNSTIPENITLYDLLITDSTEFKITFKAEDFTFVENALIYIDRQYIAENNTFKTVELPKTDSNGQTVGHFVRNDIVYNIRVIKDGVVLGNFQNIIAFCEDYLIGNCQIVLEATPEDFTIFNYDEQLGIIFQSLPTYNENTSAISFSFSTDDGTTKTVLMEVTRDDIFGNRSICNSTLTSSSGTLSCSFDPNIDDSILRADISVDGQQVVLSSVTLESSDYGNLGYVIWFFLTFLFILLFGNSKTEVLIGLAVSFIGAITLGITRGTIIGLGSAGIWILVIIILGIWKLNKENPQ